MESGDVKDTPAAAEGELNIESNQINVSNRKNQSFYVYLAKKTLEKHDDLVLHALGNATTISVIAAENLVKNGYADYVSLETKTIEVEESRRNRDNKRGQEGEQTGPVRLVKRAKLLITLKKSADFEANMQKFEAIKKENEEYIAKEKAEREKAKETAQ